MKKILFVIYVLGLTVILSACNMFYVVKPAPKSVYKNLIEQISDNDTEFMSKIANEEGACVVTILSTGSVVVKNETYLLAQAYSGIILNDDGYILTTDQAYVLEISENGTTYKGKAIETYAVLADAYNDQTHYKLNYIDHDQDSGLALFQFYDHFYYYTDSENKQSEKGFQYTADFVKEELTVGSPCISVGNSLANILVDNPKNHSSFKDINLTATLGILADTCVNVSQPVVFENKTYYPSVITTPINSEMIGGAVFNDQGKVMGIIFQKATYGTSGSSDYLKRVSFIQGFDLINSYINKVEAAQDITIFPV